MDPRIRQEYRRIYTSLAPVPVVPLDMEAHECSIEARFAHVAAQRHDAIAVQGLDATWTYAEFDALTNRVAHVLLERLGSGAEPVALVAQHRPATIAAMFGIIKAGKYIATIDPQYPPARVATILADLSTRLVIVDDSTAGLAQQLGEAGSTREWLHIAGVLGGTAPTTALDIRNQPDDYAYIIYTSGSTGMPKGVITTHRSTLNSVRQRQLFMCDGVDERALSAYPYYYTASLSTIYPSLLMGTMMAPFDVATYGFERLRRWIGEMGLTWMEGTSGMWRALLATMEPGETFPHVTRVGSGGDRISGELVQALAHTFPNAMIRTGYGASEKLFLACYFNDSATNYFPSAIPAGFAMDDIKFVIVDDAGEPVSTGQAGEIIVYSEHISPGYWRRPELNAAKFGEDERGRFYRSGDLGRLDEAGCLWLLGRRDGQLKIHGQRVETAEIEHVLIAMPAVEQALVMPYDAPHGETELAAYVSLTPGGKVDANGVRRALRQQVSLAMVPRYVTILPALPLNSNGKPDRKQMPRPAEPTAARYVPPQTPTQQRLAQMVRELLGVAQVGMADNFFDLGGTSLLGARLMLAIQRVFGVEVSPRVLIETPTLAGLAAAIEADAAPDTRPDGSSESLVVTVAEGTAGRRPFYLFLGGGGSLTELMWYANLLRRQEPEQPILAFLAQGIDGHASPFGTVDEMVATYVAEIRQRQPHGPYLLGGECVGGKLAYRVAQALREAGEEVALLALLDVVALDSDQVARQSLRQWQRRLLYHWDHVRQLTANEAAQYVWQRVGHRLRLPSMRSASVRRHLEARRVYRRLLSAYRVSTRVDVPTTLIVSEDSARRGVIEAWCEWLGSAPSVAVVPGDHRSYLATHVDATATHLARQLAAAQKEEA